MFNSVIGGVYHPDGVDQQNSAGFPQTGFCPCDEKMAERFSLLIFQTPSLGIFLKRVVMLWGTVPHGSSEQTSIGDRC